MPGICWSSRTYVCFGQRLLSSIRGFLQLAQGRGGIVFGAHLSPDKWNEYIELLWVGTVTKEGYDIHFSLVAHSKAHCSRNVDFWITVALMATG